MTGGKLYLGICRTSQEGREPHWILLYHDYGTQKCDWYHSTGGPRTDKLWEVKIEENQQFFHPHIVRHEEIWLISHSHRNELRTSAQKIPAKHCQQWVIDVLRNLETTGAIGSGTADTWAQEMTCNQESKGGSKNKGAGGASSSKDPKK